MTIGTFNSEVISVVDIPIIAYILYDHGLFLSFCTDKLFVS
jgi:hypothetical protein